MAEKNWVTVQPSLDPLIEKIQPILDTLTSVLEFLIAILNVVQVILSVMKAFLAGFLDPLRTLVELIIDEIRSLIADLRQLGVYVTGDWELVNPSVNHSSLLGGYQAYERRMLSRLLDTTDLNRPNFSSSTSVVALFLYANSGDVDEIIKIIRAVLKFLGLPHLAAKAGGTMTPTTPKVLYGLSTAATWKQLGHSDEDPVPDAVSVTWAMPAGAGGTPVVLAPSPKGFLIHVSTIPDGFTVLSLSAKSGDSAKIEDVPYVQAAGVDPTTRGPMKLYGGITDLGTNSSDYSDVESSNPVAPKLLLQKDQNTPLIKPSLLRIGLGETPYIATTFFVKAGFVTRLGAGTQFKAVFKRSSLPKHVEFKKGSDGYAEIDGEAEEAAEYYFRIRALTQEFVDALEFSGKASLSAPADLAATSNRLYYMPPSVVTQATSVVLLPYCSGNNGKSGFSAVSGASGPGIAKFPSTVQLTYLEAVKAAVTLAILCRADLSDAGEDARYKPGTFVYKYDLKGVEGVGRDLLLRYGVDSKLFQGTHPLSFRNQVRLIVGRIAADLLEKAMPPEAVAEAIVSQAPDLLSFKWSDASSSYPEEMILESLLSTDTTWGVGANPYCRGLPKETVSGEYTKEIGRGPSRGPSFSSRDTGTRYFIVGAGSADYSPVIYSNDSNPAVHTYKIEFIRNALLGYEDGILLTQAAAVLQLSGAVLSRPIGDTQWKVVRLMPQGLVPVEELLDKLDRFLASVFDSIQGIADKIIEYIDAIQARIYQLQALLMQIEALLQAIEFFALPATSGLVLVESGTGGVVSGLVSAGNKPVDDANSYGGGICIVAGGLPTVLLELMALILQGGEE